MNEQDVVRFAVVGCGHIGKRHAEMITRNPECTLIALCDIQPKEALGIDGYDVPFYSSIDELLEQEKNLDVVSICTPNGLHTEHTIQCLKAKHHVVCEKPLGLTRSSCEQMIHTSLQVSRQVFAVMQNRYSPPSVWLKDMVDSGRLGELFMVQISMYWNRDERYYKPGIWKGTQHLDGGTLFTQFSHFIDIMYWLFGDIKDIEGKFADFNHKVLTEFEDSGMVNFRFVNGGLGSINYSTAVWNKNLESSMTILGSKGSIQVSGQYMNEVVYCHVEGYEMPELPKSNPANDYGHYKGSAANHHFIFENVVDTLKHRTSATTNALEGMKVVDIIERIYNVRDK
jgi:UDP-N-acetyl-2-amino-2-deoxyglucuronate dehydrogenase